MTSSFGAHPRRTTARLRLGALLVVLVSGTVLLGVIQARGELGHTASAAATPLDVSDRLAEPIRRGAAGPGGRDDLRTLVLYDDGRRLGANQPAGAAATGEAEAYGMFTANLVSRATAWDLHPAADYLAGDADGFHAIVYVSGISDAMLPPALLRDLADSTVPVVWIGGNIEQLFAGRPGLAQRFGWLPRGNRTDKPTSVRYRGVDLTRQRAAHTDLTQVRVTDPGRSHVLATAVAESGTSSPWALRSGQFTYVAAVPFTYAQPGDRHLAVCDILLAGIAPETPERHRALVRIEDIGPRTEPEQVRAITELLSEHQIPFSLAVYPYYADPHGHANQGQPTFTRLTDAPELVDALRDALERGATLIMHGYSHQYGTLDNPYDAVSGADYEFIQATRHGGRVVTGGPVPADSRAWFEHRIATGLAEFDRVGLPVPEIFEFPHYGGSAIDYQMVTRLFSARYDQGSYYAGFCPGGVCGSADRVSYDAVHSQFFPYPVRDVYGAVIVPENLGHVAPTAFDQHDPRSVAQILADARASLVVRDNVASFFYHPFLGTGRLHDLVTGLESMGYAFTTPGEVAELG